MTTAPESLPPMAKKSNGTRTAPWARAASWIVGLTAVALLGTSVGVFLYDRKQNETMAAAYLRLIVTGPAALQSGTPAEYNITTTTVTGDPLASSIEWSLRSPDGKRLIDRNETKETAYETGRSHITIPGDMALPSPTELDVTAIHAGQREEVKTVLTVQPTQYDTQLTLDKPVYRPGETVYYRSLTLSRFALAADRAPADPLRNPRSVRRGGSRIAAGGHDRSRGGQWRVGSSPSSPLMESILGRPQHGRRLCRGEAVLFHSSRAAAGAGPAKAARQIRGRVLSRGGRIGCGPRKPRLLHRMRSVGQAGPAEGHRRRQSRQ